MTQAAIGRLAAHFSTRDWQPCWCEHQYWRGAGLQKPWGESECFCRLSRIFVALPHKIRSEQARRHILYAPGTYCRLARKDCLASLGSCAKLLNPLSRYRCSFVRGLCCA